MTKATVETVMVLTDSDCHDEVLGVLTVRNKNEMEVRAAINCVRSNIEDWDIDTLVGALENMGWDVTWDNCAVSMSI